MKISPDVIQSINEGGVDLSSSWAWFDSFVYSANYIEVYNQPMSLEAVTLDFLRFKDDVTNITIRKTTDPNSEIVWVGVSYNISDSGNGIDGDEGAVTEEQQQISTGVVGSVAPEVVYGAGTITIEGANVNLYSTPTFSGIIKTHYITSATFTLTDNSEQYLVADYNNGSPIYRLENNKLNINKSNIALIRICWRQGNTVHSIDSDCQGTALANKIESALINTTQYRKSVDGGLTLGETSTPTARTVTISSAVVYAASTPHNIAPFNSSTDLLTFTYHVGGVWTYTNGTVYNNTQYDNGTDLVTIGNNRYGVVWFYRSIGDTVQTYYVVGDADYTTISHAQTAKMRSDLPLLLRDHCMLVGRIIIQKSATSGLVENVSDVSFSSGSVSNHNDLSNIQGVGPEYFHLSNTQYTDLTDAGDSALHYHSADRARANHTGTQTASTISDFAATVRGTALTGYVVGANTALSATDTILGAFGKVQGQLNNKQATITAGTTSQYYRGDKTWQTLNTSIVPELTNLYYTQARFDTAFGAKTTTNLAEGTNKYYTDARVKTYSDTLYLPTSGIDASKIISGTIDVARIPVLPSQVPQVTTNLASLTTTQQNIITSGTVVTTSDDGWRYVYTGTGSKTSSASYVQLADISPDWSTIANRPTLGSLAAKNTVTWTSDLTGVPTSVSSLINPSNNGNLKVGGNLYNSSTWYGIEFSDPKSRAFLINDTTGTQRSGIYSVTEGWIWAFKADGSLEFGSIPWNKLTSIPATFAPSAHNHIIGDITGLQTALDGKQPLGSTSFIYQANVTQNYIAVRSPIRVTNNDPNIYYEFWDSVAGWADIRARNVRILSSTGNKVPYLNNVGEFADSAVTPTELGYLSGVTSSIQTQLTGKQKAPSYSASQPVTVVSNWYTVAKTYSVSTNAIEVTVIDNNATIGRQFFKLISTSGRYNSNRIKVVSGKQAMYSWDQARLVYTATNDVHLQLRAKTAVSTKDYMVYVSDIGGYSSSSFSVAFEADTTANGTAVGTGILTTQDLGYTTPGTYYKTTVNADGEVTSGVTSLAISDVTNLQTTLDGKQAAGNYVTTDTTQTITGVKTFSSALQVNNNLGANAIYENGTALSAKYQPLDSDLTAIAALTTTAYGRGLLPLADEAAARTYINAQVAGSYQPLDSDLTAIAALATTAYGRGFLPLADAAAARTYINAQVAGSYQPLDSDLTAIAALATTAYGRGFLPLANAAAARTYINAQVAGSYLTANQTITLSGIVSGSGTTAITTSMADGALTIAKTSGLQTALDAKLPIFNYASGAGNFDFNSFNSHAQGQASVFFATYTNAPPSWSHGSLLQSYGANGNWATQIAVGTGTEGLYFRRSYDPGNVWGAWRTVWHDGNLIGTQNGHNHAGVYLPIASKASDSEKLDGMDGSYFVQGTAASKNQGLRTTLISQSVADANTLMPSGFYDGYFTANMPQNGWWCLSRIKHSDPTGGGATMPWGVDFAGSMTDGNAEQYCVRVNNDSSWGTWRTLWHSGNLVGNQTAHTHAWVNITNKSDVINAFVDGAWAGADGYYGWASSTTTRFGFSASGAGSVDVYTDGNFYATDNSHLVWHAGNLQASSSNPSALGLVSPGTSTNYSRADHVHAMPTAAQVGAAASGHNHDTAYQPLENQRLSKTNSVQFSGIYTTSDVYSETRFQSKFFNVGEVTTAGMCFAYDASLNPTTSNLALYSKLAGAARSNANYSLIANDDNISTFINGSSSSGLKVGSYTKFSSTISYNTSHVPLNLNGYSVRCEFATISTVSYYTVDPSSFDMFIFELIGNINHNVKIPNGTYAGQVIMFSVSNWESGGSLYLNGNSNVVGILSGQILYTAWSDKFTLVWAYNPTLSAYRWM